jgi:hypothetical protein
MQGLVWHVPCTERMQAVLAENRQPWEAWVPMHAVFVHDICLAGDACAGETGTVRARAAPTTALQSITTRHETMRIAHLQ